MARYFEIDDFTIVQWPNGEVLVYSGTGSVYKRFHYDKRLTKRRAKYIAKQARWSKDIDDLMEGLR